MVPERASSRASLAPTGFVSFVDIANDTIPVGARLAREGVIPNATPHPGFFEIRNDLALASTTRYITTVISSGKRK